MKRLKIAVLSVSAGAGHVRAAQALCAQAALTHPEWQMTHIDLMDIVPRTFRKLYAESYIKLVEKAPLLWVFQHFIREKLFEDLPVVNFLLNCARSHQPVHGDL